MTCAVGARPGRFSDGIARPVMAVGALRKLALPCQRVGNNGLQIVKMRFPIESGADAIAGGDELGGVARAAPGELDLEIDAGDALHALDHFQYGKTAAVAAIERGGGAAGAQMGERVAVRGNKIGDVNVISDAGAVRRRIVGAENA